MTTHDGLPARAKMALEGLRVLDLSEGTADLCARLLGDLGADVIKVEPPEGDFLRHRGPYAHNLTHEERSLAWLAFNTNKRSITLDLADPSHRAFVQGLASQADVLVESAAPEHLADLGLGYEELSQENPALVYVSLTPFGQSGPYSQHTGTELRAQALGGLLATQGD
ncbi:MAG: CoA transferase [Chloroflexi bacterium]|nr:CoA transferase [Chloroflexota bacterium]